MFLEDRASNAYMQILIALATRKIDVLKRFMTPEAFETAKKTIIARSVAYNRLYIAETRLLSIESEGNFVRAHIGVEYFSQFVILGQSSARAIDTEVIGSIRIVTFVHEMTGQIAKGNIFANACPKCGASQTDSLAVVFVLIAALASMTQSLIGLPKIFLMPLSIARELRLNKNPQNSLSKSLVRTNPARSFFRLVLKGGAGCKTQRDILALFFLSS